MEMMAAITGIRALKGRCAVTLYTDSQYLANAMTNGWAKRWQANGWKRNKTDKALNPDLWQQLLDLSDQHAVTFAWVRGHAGTVENERCDQLSRQAAGKPDLPVDTAYEANIRAPQNKK
jgi:ribonuclease HI